MGDAPFFFSSNDPVSREVMMSQERVELNSQGGGKHLEDRNNHSFFYFLLIYLFLIEG